VIWAVDHQVDRPFLFARKFDFSETPFSLASEPLLPRRLRSCGMFLKTNFLAFSNQLINQLTDLYSYSYPIAIDERPFPWFNRDGIKIS